MNALVSGAQPDPPLPLETRMQLEEYQYRRAMHATHDEYMDAEQREVAWMIRIDQAFQRAENEANKRASSGG